jgi:type I restriction enzyme M protein
MVTLQLTDFASGAPPYVQLRNYIKFSALDETKVDDLSFKAISPSELIKEFGVAHNLVWKKEKLNPTDAFFEFCKFIFLKIREDRRRKHQVKKLSTYELPLTSEWLEAQKGTSDHPVRDVLFKKLHEKLEDGIAAQNKKRIFEPQETLKLMPSTCMELIKRFEHIDLSSMDEDLNGRMFEVFLASAVQGKELGQFFTPRPVVDFMTRIGLFDTEINNGTRIIDACAGTGGFLIEAMAYLIAGLREDTRFTPLEKEKINQRVCNEQLYGIEANERVARVARVNMYLHGDGGSHIFHGDGLDKSPVVHSGFSTEKKREINDQKTKVRPDSFDLVLSNPPFSMNYSKTNPDESRILEQREFMSNFNKLQSKALFIERYHELLSPGGSMLIILDDTLLNGANFKSVREWLLNKFVLLGVHSLPFNAFFKAKANIKTSVLHLRKKLSEDDTQGHVFMSISNNVGHNNSLNDTYDRNNLNNIFNAYVDWKRKGELDTSIENNHDLNENLECAEQIWIQDPNTLSSERLDAFFYSPELSQLRTALFNREKSGEIELIKGRDVDLRLKLSASEKLKLSESDKLFKYIEIGDVTKFGMITSYIEAKIEDIPSRGQYRVAEGDLLFALNISSRGTVARVPKEFDGAICTSGFLVIRPKDKNDGMLLLYSLRSEQCRKQIYYLSQTASQPELKIDIWKNEFLIPMPLGSSRSDAIANMTDFLSRIDNVMNFSGAVFN